jgi:acyl-CoA thioester hydrolase
MTDAKDAVNAVKAAARDAQKDAAERRADYRWTLSVPTRWMDNDVYGHVNNVVYYAYFDTVINRWLIDEGGLDIHAGDAVGLCVESQCRYLAPTAFPDVLEACLRVAHLGRSSVRYEIAIFSANTEAPVAVGTFVHVFVDRASRRPTPIPDAIRAALARLTRPT